MQRAWGVVRGAVQEFNNVLNADSDDDDELSEEAEDGQALPAKKQYQQQSRRQPVVAVNNSATAAPSLPSLAVVKDVHNVVHHDKTNSLDVLPLKVTDGFLALSTNDRSTSSEVLFPVAAMDGGQLQQQQLSEDITLISTTPPPTAAAPLSATTAEGTGELLMDDDDAEDAADRRGSAAAAATMMMTQPSLVLASGKGEQADEPHEEGEGGDARPPLRNLEPPQFPPVEVDSPGRGGVIGVQDRAMVDLVLEAAATLQRKLDDAPLMNDATVREAQAENLKWRTTESSVGVFLESSYEGSPASSTSPAVDTAGAKVAGTVTGAVAISAGATAAAACGLAVSSAAATAASVESEHVITRTVAPPLGSGLDGGGGELSEGTMESTLALQAEDSAVLTSVAAVTEEMLPETPNAESPLVNAGESQESLSCLRRIHHPRNNGPVELWTGPDTVGSAVVTAWENFCDSMHHVEPLKGLELLQSIMDRRPVTVTDLEPICERTLQAAATMLPLLGQTEKTAQLVPKLNADLGEAQSKISELTAQIAAMKELHRKDIETLQACNARQQVELVATQERLEAANAKLRRAHQQQQRGSLAGRLEELEDQVDDLNDQLEKWQEAHAVLAESQHKAGAELAEWRDRCHMLEPIAAEADKLRKKTEEQEMLLADTHRIRQRSLALEEEIGSLRMELTEARDVISRLNSLIETIQKDSAGTSVLVERRLRTTLNELEACRAKLDEAEIRLAASAAMEAQFQALQRANAEAAEALTKLSQDNELMNSSIVKLLKRLEAKAIEEEHYIDRRILEEKIKKYYAILHSQGMVNLIGTGKEEMLCVVAEACDIDTAVRQQCLGITETISRRVAAVRAIAVSPDTKNHQRGISSMFLDFLESEAAA